MLLMWYSPATMRYSPDTTSVLQTQRLSLPRYRSSALFSRHNSTTTLLYLGRLSDTTGWWRLIGCLKLQVIFRKQPRIEGLVCGKWPIKIRYPMTLRHPAEAWCVVVTHPITPSLNNTSICVCNRILETRVIGRPSLNKTPEHPNAQKCGVL